MYLVSLSQPHDAASVLELSRRSLEFEHEVRREVTLQVMRWFGHVDDADERWKTNVEKVVRQSRPGYFASVQGQFPRTFFFLPSILVDPYFCFWRVLYLQNDPISEDEFMTKWNTTVGDTFISNTSLRLLTVSIPSPLSVSGALYNGRRNREIISAYLLHFPPQTR